MTKAQFRVLDQAIQNGGTVDVANTRPDLIRRMEATGWIVETPVQPGALRIFRVTDAGRTAHSAAH